MKTTKFISLSFLLLLSVSAAAASWVAPPPNLQQVNAARASPSWEHPFGRDALGRDLLSRVLHGTRVSLFVGLGSACIAVVLGTVFGGFSGYRGGWVDALAMRFVDLWYALPALLLIILFKEILEQGNPKRGLWAILLALSFYSWMHVARIVRGEVLRLKQLPFVEAAQTGGLNGPRVLFRHILPNLWGLLLVTLILRIPLNILAESMLGFVGLGVKSPMPSWGTLASEGWAAMRFFPHLILFPSLILFVSVLSLTVLAEEIRSK